MLIEGTDIVETMQWGRGEGDNRALRIPYTHRGAEGRMLREND